MCLVLLCLSNEIALMILSLVNEGELTSICSLGGNAMLESDLLGVVYECISVINESQCCLY